MRHSTLTHKSKKEGQEKLNKSIRRTKVKMVKKRNERVTDIYLFLQNKKDPY